jgi:NADH-quinone oxidoreductase subunit F/NADP-reducing hydrogenase subunit HndC
MDEDDCMVDVSKFYMEFCVDESCGKCAPCRIGTREILNLLTKITEGKGEMSDLQKIEDIGFAMQKSALCALGQTAPNPTMSTITKFRSEYEEHIRDKKCRALKCKSMISYVITDKCTGCTLCARNCPQECISGELKKQHTIDQLQCIRCGLCKDTCRFSAIVKR